MAEDLDRLGEELRSMCYARSGLDDTGALTGSVDGLKPGANLVLYREP